ncbi:hypothetical protein M3Y98_00750900 [Aphelenchoides besseyi]|nr:hypothetical protein M3Y98_00750900 [Aphelenchoides besseyi]KAI6211550.1 hypothetical protein M3Y96_00446400 [Aphelenchoides besseyi]
MKGNSKELLYPDYIVHSAGTGGTLTSVGRYVRKFQLPTQVVLVDTQFSIYYEFVINHRFMNESEASVWQPPGMEGTGFGYAGPARFANTTSLQPAIIDRAFKVADLASTAGILALQSIGNKTFAEAPVRDSTMLLLYQLQLTSENHTLHKRDHLPFQTFE